ncbi:MAG: sulfotransferase [Colwellia sp.]
MKKTNLFIVGAAKAGTTSVVSYLNQHPDIFMSPLKEPHYFSSDIKFCDYKKSCGFNKCLDVKAYLNEKVLVDEHISVVEELDDYQALFRGVGTERVLGEASTGYLYSVEAAKEIYSYNENASIVIILRNPIERAYSHWKMNLSSGLEAEGSLFVESIKSDYLKTKKGYFVSNLYIELGLYSEQIKRFKELFPETMYVLFYEDLVKGTEEFMGQLYSTLGIESETLEYYPVENASQISSFPKLKNLVQKIGLANVMPRSVKKFVVNKTSHRNFPRLLDSDRRYLYNEFFRDEIDSLELLLDCDLSDWKYK